MLRFCRRRTAQYDCRQFPVDFQIHRIPYKSTVRLTSGLVPKRIKILTSPVWGGFSTELLKAPLSALLNTNRVHPLPHPQSPTLIMLPFLLVKHSVARRN